MLGTTSTNRRRRLWCILFMRIMHRRGGTKHQFWIFQMQKNDKEEFNLFIEMSDHDHNSTTKFVLDPRYRNPMSKDLLVSLSMSWNSWYFAATLHVTNSSDATGQFLSSLCEIRTCSISLASRVLDPAQVASRLAWVIMKTALKVPVEGQGHKTRQNETGSKCSRTDNACLCYQRLW